MWVYFGPAIPQPPTLSDHQGRHQQVKIQRAFLVLVASLVALIALPASADPSTVQGEDAKGCGRSSSVDEIVSCLDGVLMKGFGSERLSGVLMASDKGGEIVHRSYGDSGDGRPPTPDTAFRLASLTKPVVAFAILLAAEAGELSLDDPIAVAWPEFSGAEAVGSIQIRDLLDHSARLNPGADLEDLELAADWSVVVDASEGEARYANLHYQLAARLLVFKTGRTVESWVTGEFPLMKGAFEIGAWPEGRAQASGYAVGLFDDTPVESLLPAWCRDALLVGGAGGGIATPRAMMAFGRGVAQAAVERPLIGDAVRNRSAGDYALGWVIYDEKAPRMIWHNGAFEPHGWQHMLIWVPETDIIVGYFGNRDLSGGDIINAIRTALVFGDCDSSEGFLFSRVFITVFQWNFFAILALAGLLLGAARIRKEENPWTTGLLPIPFFVSVLLSSTLLHLLLFVPALAYPLWGYRRRGWHLADTAPLIALVLLMLVRLRL